MKSERYSRYTKVEKKVFSLKFLPERLALNTTPTNGDVKT